MPPVSNSPNRVLQFVVADSRPADYAAVRAALASPVVAWRFVTTAHEALHVARRQHVDLWLINTKLPDLSALELCGMLRNSHLPQAVCVVADACDADAERGARIRGASLFLCKPLDAGWLEGLIDRLLRRPNGMTPACVSVVRGEGCAQRRPHFHHHST